MNSRALTPMALTVVALAAALLACCPSSLLPQPTPSPTTPACNVRDDFSYVDEPSVGLSFARPTDWQRQAGDSLIEGFEGQSPYVVYFTTGTETLNVVNIVTYHEPTNAEDSGLSDFLLGDFYAAMREERGVEVFEELSDVDLTVVGPPGRSSEDS